MKKGGKFSTIKPPCGASKQGSQLRANEGGGGGRLLTCVNQLAKNVSFFCKAYSSCSWKDGVAGSVFHLLFLCEDFREVVKQVMKHSKI